MTPVLFPANATTFATQGLGALSDAISCTVMEERNGEFELEMQYPQTGVHFADISDRCIILAIPSPWRTAQPFRIYRITKPMNGVCTIYARHITYDLGGIPVNVFSAQNVASALAGLKSNSAAENPFEFWTDKTTTANFAVKTPAKLRSCLGGKTGSILDVYGGEYEWDGMTVKLHNNRGTDRGVTIRYGKNLTDIEQDRNIANVRTGIYPYWTNSDGGLVVCDPPVVNAPGSYDFVNIDTVDFSQDFEEQPTPAQLKERAEQYISANNIGVPSVSISVSFVDLSQTDQYKGMALLEQCDLCDTVTVQFEELGVNATAKIVRIETDVLLGRYKTIEVGSLRTNITDTIVGNNQATNEKIDQTASWLEKQVQEATDQITNGGGYIYRIYDANKNLVEIGSTDNLDLSKAKNVWRWNNGGFGHSGNGYNGPYRTAITQDGHIVADFIDAGTLTANIIRAGILQDMKGWNFWDLETGEFRLAAAATVNGQQIATKAETISGVDVEYASGSSQTTPPTSEWSTTAPAWQDGRYIWQRTVTTLADGTKSISEPTCIQGAKGPQGPAGKNGANGINGKDGTNGKDGASAYVHIKYAPVANPTDTQMTETPSEYIGICTNTTPTDPTTANSYQWSKWQGQDGAQGIPGTPGTNGQTTYVHFAYSTTADGTGNFSTTPFDDARYVGVCTDFKQADPTTPSSYQWSRMQGDGVSQIVEQYYLSTSSTTQTGGSWSTAQPKWRKGRYIWTRSMVTWTDGTTTYTDPVLAQAINGANQSASDAQQSVDDLDNSLNSEGVFNRLTDNGKIQGIYMSGGQLYINGSYIKSGTLNANLIRAGILQDVEGEAFYLDLANGVLRMNATELSISGAPAASQSYAQQQAQAAQQAAISAAAKSLNDYADTVTASLDDLQQQVDGQITTYFYDYKPTKNNAPANEWTTVEEMRRHAGDLFYNTSNGDAYRWAQLYGTWQWLEIVDTDVAAALAAAAAAQDTADSKRRVFTAQPVPPYDVGDLWAEENNGPLQVCITAKASGAAFAAADWTDAANYTAQAAEAGRNLVVNSGNIRKITATNLSYEGEVMVLSIQPSATTRWITVKKDISEYGVENLRGKSVTVAYDYQITETISYDSSGSGAIGALCRLEITYSDGTKQFIGAPSDDVKSLGTAVMQDFVRVAATETVQDKEISTARFVMFAQFLSGTIKYRNPKVELGIFSTPWSPAPEDTEIAAEAPALDQLGTFNKLTNNGQLQGIYMSGGQLYINGSYIRAGTIDASRVNVTNLNADNIKSGTITGRTISGGTITGTKITGASVLGSSVRSESDNGAVSMYDGRISLFDPEGNEVLAIVPGGSNNPANLYFFLPGFGHVGNISCQNDNGLGRIVVDCANNGFFTTNRIQAKEIAVTRDNVNGGLYSDGYRSLNGNYLMRYENGIRQCWLDRLALNGGAMYGLQWVNINGHYVIGRV